MRGLLVLLAILVGGASPGRASDEARRVAEELAILRVPTEIEHAVDTKDWPRARSFFAPTVRVETNLAGGGPPVTIPADALIAAWSGNLRGAKQSLHIRGAGLVTLEGDRARVVSNGYAWNKLPGGPDGDLWEVWGRYEHTLIRTPEGWRVAGFTFRATHERGSTWVRDTAER